MAAEVVKRSALCGLELSEAAQAELLKRCEDQFARLEKLHNEIILGEADSCGNEQSVNALLATEAELRQRVTAAPTLLAENSEIFLQAGKEEMLKLCSELQMIVSCSEATRDKLRDTKQLEQTWLAEKKQVLVAAGDHVERLQAQREKQSELSVLHEIKDKIEKLKVYQERLMESLGEVLEKHIPVPHKESASNKKKKVTAAEFNKDLISMNEILEMLMNQFLNAPHDPYVTLDETFWPPYVEMLLRYGIAVRHPENSFKIRMETFF